MSVQVQTAHDVVPATIVASPDSRHNPQPIPRSVDALPPSSLSQKPTSFGSAAQIPWKRLLRTGKRQFRQWNKLHSTVNEAETRLGQLKLSLFDAQLKLAQTLYDLKQHPGAKCSWEEAVRKVGVKHRNEADRLVKGFEVYFTSGPIIQQAMRDAGASPHRPLIAAIAAELKDQIAFGSADVNAPEFQAYCVARFKDARRKDSAAANTRKSSAPMVDPDRFQRHVIERFKKLPPGQARVEVFRSLLQQLADLQNLSVIEDAVTGRVIIVLEGPPGGAAETAALTINEVC